MNNQLFSEKIRDLANSGRIDVLGFATAHEFPDYALNHSRRQDPKLTLPDARTIIVAGLYIGRLILDTWTNSWYGRTSRLFLSGFFLDVGKPLEPIVNFLKSKGYQEMFGHLNTAIPYKIFHRNLLMALERAKKVT